MDKHCADLYIHYLINPYNNPFYRGGKGNAEGKQNLLWATQLVNDGGGGEPKPASPQHRLPAITVDRWCWIP